MDDVGSLEWWRKRAQWLSERVDALNTENRQLRTERDSLEQTFAVEAHCHQHDEARIARLLDAITTADLQIGDGHIKNARQTLHAAMDAA